MDIRKSMGHGACTVFFAVSLALVLGCGPKLINPYVAPEGPAFLNLTNFQSADLVIGQSGFNSNAVHAGGGNVTSQTIRATYGQAAVYGNVLLLPDTYNHRILGYNTFPTQNFPAADFVIGQPNMTTGGPGCCSDVGAGTGAHNLAAVVGLSIYENRLFASGFQGLRVNVWNSVPLTTATPADYVLGQDDFTSVNTTCDDRHMHFGTFTAVANGRLFAVNQGHNRVMVWNQIPTSSGTPADFVLGQPNFTTCTTGTSASKLAAPRGIAVIGDRLYVSDSGNHRMMVWNSIPSSNVPADFVFGQSDFTSAVSGFSQSKITAPYGLATNGTQLFMVDRNNNRILIWNSAPTGSASLPDLVIGQSDFTHRTAFDDNQDNVTDSQPSARTFSSPAGVYADGKRMIVMDDNRVLIFNSR